MEEKDVEVNYNMTMIIKLLEDWLKETGCYTKENKQPMTFTVFGSQVIIVTPNASKMIGKGGNLIRKYSSIFGKYLCIPNLQIQVYNPKLLISVGGPETNLILYKRDNT